MADPSLTLVLTLVALNLVFAVLVLSARPRTLAHWLMALWFTANGIAVALILNFIQGPTLAERPTAWLHVPLQASTMVPIVMLPFLFPRRLIKKPMVIALLTATIVIALIGAATSLLFLSTQIRDFAAIAQSVDMLTHLGLAIGVIVYTEHCCRAASTTASRNVSRWFLAAYASTAATILLNSWGPLANTLTSPFSFTFVMNLLATGTGTIGVVFALGYSFTRIMYGMLSSRSKQGARAGIALLPITLGTAAGVLIFLSPLPNQWNWLLLRPLLFTYAIVQFQFLDVPYREQMGLIGAAIVLLLAASMTSAISVAEAYNFAIAEQLAVGVLTMLIVAGVFAYPVTRFVIRQGRDTDATGIYRAALEQVVVSPDPMGGSSDAALASLRQRLSIGERQHQSLVLELQAARGEYRNMSLGRSFLARYRIKAELGKGGFATTYAAVDDRLGRPVVLKVDRPERGADQVRALREARALALIGHRNIVSIYDVEEVGDEIILVLEHLEGGSLEERLRKGPFLETEARQVVLAMLAALEAAHAEGLVHRDIKPSNILFDRDGTVKLADFGLVARSSTSETAVGFTLTQAAAGSLRYMAPEQVREGAVDARTDLYSLGVVGYEMLTGRSYLDLDTKDGFETRRAILEDVARLDDPRVPMAWRSLLDALLAKDAAGRPTTARDVSKMLESVDA